MPQEFSVKLSESEAVLALYAIEAKIREYKDFPPEAAKFFLGPYIELREGIAEALQKAQTPSSSEPGKAK